MRYHPRMQRRQVLEAIAASAAVPLSLKFAPLAAQPSPRPLSSHDAVVRPLLERMTLDDKLGQMTQGELNQIKDESDVERLALGSVLSGGNADPATGNDLASWTKAVERLIRLSLKTRLKIPILYGVDAVHGHSNVEGAVIFPHNIGLGCTRDPKLVEEIGRVTALEVRATGIQWTFAPCVAVPRDIRWGRTYEGFGESPELVSELGAAAIRGLQHGDLGAPEAVLACAKHYIGDGGTTYAPHAMGNRTVLLDQGDTEVDEATLRRLYLPPYRAAVAAGVGSIMVSYNSWNGAKVTGIHRLLTEILKDELGFEGFLITDYYAIGQIDKDYKTAVMQAVNAGMDMAMEPARYERFISTLRELVDEGRVPIARIDDAVKRILRVKVAMGLLNPRRDQLAERALRASFGSAAHRALARRAVSASLVLLKNAGGVLPLTETAQHIHVAGRGADDIGIQCGGWTIKWQGSPGPITTGTTIRAGIEARAGERTRVTYSADGAGAAGADAAIVMVGEAPYAEGVGDRSDLTLGADDVALVERVAATGTPTIVIVISGRPLILGGVLDRAAAVLAAWLPGSEGAGVADVLFGDRAPTAKLSHRWPRTMADVPLGTRETSDALFPYGFGLDYTDNQ